MTAEPLPDLLRLTGRQMAAIDCARCGRRLGVHARLLGEVDDRHGHLLPLAACATGCTPLGPLGDTVLLRPVPAGPRAPRPAGPPRPPARPWRPPPGVRLPASARLPRWQGPPDTIRPPRRRDKPPQWAEHAPEVEVFRRVLAGLRRMSDGRPRPG